jgi:hypothetical protein
MYYSVTHMKRLEIFNENVYVNRFLDERCIWLVVLASRVRKRLPIEERELLKEFKRIGGRVHLVAEARGGNEIVYLISVGGELYEVRLHDVDYENNYAGIVINDFRGVEAWKLHVIPRRGGVESVCDYC